VAAEPSKPAVGMPELLKIEHDAWPARPRTPLRESAGGEHGGTATRLGRAQGDPRQRLRGAEVLSSSGPRKLNVGSRVTTLAMKIGRLQRWHKRAKPVPILPAVMPTQFETILQFLLLNLSIPLDTVATNTTRTIPPHEGAPLVSK